jgi:hypothetical protein
LKDLKLRRAFAAAAHEVELQPVPARVEELSGTQINRCGGGTNPSAFTPAGLVLVTGCGLGTVGTSKLQAAEVARASAFATSSFRVSVFDADTMNCTSRQVLKLLLCIAVLLHEPSSLPIWLTLFSFLRTLAQ